MAKEKGIQKKNNESRSIVEQIHQQKNENEIIEDRLIIDRNIIEDQIQEKKEKNESRSIVQQINNTESHQHDEFIEDRVIIDGNIEIQGKNKRKNPFDELISNYSN